MPTRYGKTSPGGPFTTIRLQISQAKHGACLLRELYGLRFEQDNRANPTPIVAEFRLDAGFGTYENIALLLEMGYEVYKALNPRLSASLRRRSDLPSAWERVGANAKMVAWSALQLTRCPYPLDVGPERFQHGEKIEPGPLLHFGDDRVTENLAQWFAHNNGRQLIEAGIKESKQVFFLQSPHRSRHLSARTIDALCRQLHPLGHPLAGWTGRPPGQYPEPPPDGSQAAGAGGSACFGPGDRGYTREGVKVQFVQCLFRSGIGLAPESFPALGLKSCGSMPFFTESLLVAQKLG